MLLKANDTADFNLTMNLRIDWELEYIELIVSTWNKKTNKTITKTFPAAEFDKALTYFEQQERMFL